MDTTARASSAAWALERQQWAYSGTSHTATSKHGSSRTERPRLGASVDGEARQETALRTVRPRGVDLGVALSSFTRDVVELRWTVSLATTCRVSFTSSTKQRHTANGSKLSRTSFSSSDHLDCFKSVVDCSVRSQMSNCTVRWRTIFQHETRAQTRVEQKSAAHALFRREHDCSVEQVISSSAPKPCARVQVRCQRRACLARTAANVNIHVHTKKLTEI